MVPAVNGDEAMNGTDLKHENMKSHGRGVDDRLSRDDAPAPEGFPGGWAGPTFHPPDPRK
jgi:hypothetical protein